MVDGWIGHMVSKGHFLVKLFCEAPVNIRIMAPFGITEHRISGLSYGEFLSLTHHEN